MKRILPFLSILLIVLTSAKKGVDLKPISIDKTFTIEVPLKYIVSETLYNLLKKTNENAVYASVLTAPEGNVTFLVSKYRYDAEISITDAFEMAKGHSAAPIGYKLIDAQTYKAGEKTLYCKISELTFESGKKVNNIMYYIMKGDKASAVYELKISCLPERLEANKKRLEQIVLSVAFL